jgi:GNAT superfamily N-acetyltransferase
MQRMLLTLPDGTTAFVRPIAPEDKPLLVEGLRKLSPETSFRRFLSPKVSFTAAELRYLTEVDGRDHIAYVAFLDCQFVGVARCVRTEPDTAEMAITIGDPWQGRGLGRALAALVAEKAREQGITKIAGTMLAQNKAAFRLMRGFGTQMDRDVMSHGVREVVTRLAA